ncbi:hypothetical protein CCS38_30560, partial [Streptomyces purpurogeneiscleroticus]|nr:hypothetical protein [Streptomyces purpurogeneiscleroticus]
NGGDNGIGGGNGGDDSTGGGNSVGGGNGGDDSTGGGDNGATGGSTTGGDVSGGDDGTGTDNEGTKPIEQPGDSKEDIANTPGQAQDTPQGGQQQAGGELAETGSSGTTFLLIGAATMIAGGIGFRMMPRLINKGGAAAA